MAKLMNQTQQKIITGKLSVARDFYSRGKGLLGKSHLPEDEALWIHRCNSIHTFFMKFPIDCVFLDSKLKVRLVAQDVKPWRLLLPVWGASSVIEMAAGRAAYLGIKHGDQLHVGD